MTWSVWQAMQDHERLLIRCDTAEAAHAIADSLEAAEWSGIHVALDPNNDTSLLHQHRKVYENTQLLSNPPQQRWICAKCGEEGIDVRSALIPDDYATVRQKFGRHS